VSRVPRALAEPGKALLRSYGTATARWRPLPDFLIIGTKRGGTTSLYRYLLEHPCVMNTFPRAEQVKGTYFFDENYGHGPAWYRSHFPSRAARAAAVLRHDRVLCGEGSPYYLFHPLAAGRAAELVPQARLVVLLRDPVERAWSHYKERVRNGTETLPFAEALDAEPERLAGEEDRLVAGEVAVSAHHRHHSYVAQGRYVEGLRRWIEAFDRVQLQVVLSEDFYRDPGAVLAATHRFLGVEPRPLAAYAAHNYHPADDLDPDCRARLEEALRPSVVELEALLGMDTGWSWAHHRVDRA
jgi:Sulfotransferase domain